MMGTMKSNSNRVSGCLLCDDANVDCHEEFQPVDMHEKGNALMQHFSCRW